MDIHKKLQIFILSALCIPLGIAVVEMKAYPLYLIIIGWAVYSALLLSDHNYSSVRAFSHVFLVLTLPYWAFLVLQAVDRI